MALQNNFFRLDVRVKQEGWLAELPGQIVGGIGFEFLRNERAVCRIFCVAGALELAVKRKPGAFAVAKDFYDVVPAVVTLAWRERPSGNSRETAHLRRCRFRAVLAFSRELDLLNCVRFGPQFTKANDPQFRLREPALSAIKARSNSALAVRSHS